MTVGRGGSVGSVGWYLVGVSVVHVHVHAVHALVHGGTGGSVRIWVVVGSCGVHGGHAPGGGVPLASVGCAWRRTLALLSLAFLVPPLLGNGRSVVLVLVGLVHVWFYGCSSVHVEDVLV